MRTLRRLVAAMALALCAPIVQATLIFSFSFDKPVPDLPPNPIKGEIYLENKPGAQPAAKVILTSIGSHTTFGHLLPFDVLDPLWSGPNSFTVVGNAISEWSLSRFHNHNADSIVFEWLDLGNEISGPFFFSVNFQDQSGSVTETTSSSSPPNFRLLNGVSVPTPSVLLLLGIGLLALHAARGRQRTMPSR